MVVASIGMFIVVIILVATHTFSLGTTLSDRIASDMFAKSRSVLVTVWGSSSDTPLFVSDQIDVDSGTGKKLSVLLTAQMRSRSGTVAHSDNALLQGTYRTWVAELAFTPGNNVVQVLKRGPVIAAFGADVRTGFYQNTDTFEAVERIIRDHTRAMPHTR